MGDSVTRSQQAMIDRIVATCVHMDLRFETKHQRTNHYVHFILNHVHVFISTGSALSGKSVDIQCRPSKNVPQERRLDVAKAMCVLNYKLKVGCWEMDFRDGQIAFKMNHNFGEIDIESSPSVPVFISNAIHICAGTFANGIGKISQAAGISLSDADGLGMGQQAGETPLFAACRSGNLEKVREEVLNRRANVNQENAKGVTPLIAAACAGEEKVCTFLLERGADINHENLNQDTPLSLAIWKRQSNCAILLIRKGANCNHKDKFGDTPLIDAMKFGMLDAVKEMVRKNGLHRLELNHRNKNGQNVFDIASQNEGDLDVRSKRAQIAAILRGGRLDY